MDSLAAFPITDIDGVQISDGASQMLLHGKDGSSRPVVLAFPQERLTNLVYCTAVAQRRTSRVLHADSRTKDTLLVSACELTPMPDSTDTALSLTLEGGEARLNFRLEEATLRQLHEALKARFG